MSATCCFEKALILANRNALLLWYFGKQSIVMRENSLFPKITRDYRFSVSEIRNFCIPSSPIPTCKRLHWCALWHILDKSPRPSQTAYSAASHALVG